MVGGALPGAAANWQVFHAISELTFGNRSSVTSGRRHEPLE